MNDISTTDRWRYVYATLLLIGVAAVLTLTDATNPISSQVFKQYARLLPESSKKQVVLIVIDEKSLLEIGSLPWSLDTHVTLLNSLTNSGVKSVGYLLAINPPDLSDLTDRDLQKLALRQKNQVVLAVFPYATRTDITAQSSGELSNFGFALGHTQVDGTSSTMYRFQSKIDNGVKEIPAFSLALLHAGGVELYKSPYSDKTIHMNTGIDNPWIDTQTLLIPRVTQPSTLQQYNYADILKNRPDPIDLRGQIVLVGKLGPEIAVPLARHIDNQTSPLGEMKIQAELVHALINNRFAVPASQCLTLIATTLFLSLPLALILWRGVSNNLALTFCLVSFAMLCSALVLRFGGVWIDPSSAVLLLILGFPLMHWYRVEELAQHNHNNKVLLNAIVDAVFTLTPDGRIVYMNASAETMAGEPLEKCRNRDLKSVIIPNSSDTKKAFDSGFAQCKETQSLIRGKQALTIKNSHNSIYTVNVSFGATVDRKGRLVNILVSISDLSGNFTASRQLAFQATHDALTKLPNRNLLLDRLNLAIKRADRSKQMIAILFIDLDQFKHINDGLGHAIGDRLLQCVAQKLRLCARQGDTIARLGGDEFVVLLEGLDHSDVAASVAYKVLELANTPYLVDEQTLHISSSIGISVYPRDGNSAVDLLKHADTAMYQVKSSGRNDLSFFSAEMNKNTLRRLEIEKNLHHALREDEFIIHYQPQFSIPTGQITGVEALIRCPNNTGLHHSPNEFIPVAEDTGLIFSIGDWVLRSACEQVMEWNKLGLQPRRLSVNISPRQMIQRQFAQIIIDALHDSGLPAAYLELEITEYSIMTDLQHVAGILQAFKAIGCPIAVDDFGTGYSSLNYLKYLPIDTLKIDQSFVADIVDREEDRAITQAIITMAHGLNITVIGEGVENAMQLEVLREQSCDEFQGHLLSVPLSAGEMTEYLKNYSVGHTT